MYIHVYLAVIGYVKVHGVLPKNKLESLVHRFSLNLLFLPLAYATRSVCQKDTHDRSGRFTRIQL